MAISGLEAVGPKVKDVDKHLTLKNAEVQTKIVRILMGMSSKTCHRDGIILMQTKRPTCRFSFSGVGIVCDNKFDKYI